MLGKQKNRWDVERKAGKNPEKKTGRNFNNKQYQFAHDPKHMST